VPELLRSFYCGGAKDLGNCGGGSGSIKRCRATPRDARRAALDDPAGGADGRDLRGTDRLPRTAAGTAGGGRRGGGANAICGRARLADDAGGDPRPRQTTRRLTPGRGEAEICPAREGFAVHRPGENPELGVAGRARDVARYAKGTGRNGRPVCTRRSTSSIAIREAGSALYREICGGSVPIFDGESDGPRPKGRPTRSSTW